MKKMIIMACAVALAGVVNAASCTWGSGTLKGAASAEGGWGTTTLTSALVTMNVYLVDATTYESLGTATAQSLYDSYSKTTASLTGTNANGVDANGNPRYKGAISITQNNAAAEVQYAVVIATYTDATFGDMYIATTAQSAYNAGTEKGTAGNLISTPGSASGWQTAAAVPEPTSGLLMLVGLAGLALRRRRV